MDEIIGAPTTRVYSLDPAPVGGSLVDLDELYRLLRVSYVQAQGVVDTIRDPLLVLDEGFCIQSANPAFYRTFDTDRDATLGRLLQDLGNGQWNLPDLQVLLQQVLPKSRAVVDFAVTGDFPKIGARTMLVSAQRLHHPDDGRRLILLSVRDATAERIRDDERNMMIGEVRHRLKNLISVTQALAKQTRVEERTAAEYRDAFLGRFRALSRALEVSMEGKATELPLLATAVLAPYLGEGRAIVIGEEPIVPLLARQAMSLGMILHELATNAVKHGALSSAAGKVTVGWCLKDNEKGLASAVINWNETGGPPVPEPEEMGFGMRLVRSAAERDLGGCASVAFRPTGVEVSVSFALG